jgi:hypothetical protein
MPKNRLIVAVNFLKYHLRICRAIFHTARNKNIKGAIFLGVAGGLGFTPPANTVIVAIAPCLFIN